MTNAILTPKASTQDNRATDAKPFTRAGDPLLATRIAIAGEKIEGVSIGSGEREKLIEKVKSCVPTAPYTA